MSETILANFPPSWQEKIKTIAACRNQTSETIVREALAQYLGESTQQSRLQTVETEVQHLQRTVQDLQQRLQQAASVISFSSPLPTTSGTDEEDALEDEPDEILYDFLPPEERPYGS